MRKIVICVEGDTEFWFLAWLLPEVAGYGKVHLKLAKQHGGTYQEFREQGAPEDAAAYAILLINCACDGKVKPFILERNGKWAAQGYEYILGLLDLWPKTLDQLEDFENGLSQGLDKSVIPVKLVVAVKEIEAWFLNEKHHFEKINASLTVNAIKENTGFDPSSDNAETKIFHPAVMLAKIYGIVSLDWDKKQGEILRTVNALDPASLYENVRQMSKSLDKFLGELDALFNAASGVPDVSAV